MWEASNRICGKRLKALIPTLVPAMERHGHLILAPEIRAALLSISAATIDRALRLQREHTSAGGRRRGAVSAIRRAMCNELDPVRLLAEIRTAQQALVALANQPADAITPRAPVPVAEFLAELRTAWKAGEVRPTAQVKPKAKRGRRRPDPLMSVTEELRGWFEADRLCTGGEPLTRLQAAYPGDYPEGLLRTVQRRLKLWRTEIATSLVLGPPGAQASTTRPSGASV